MNYLITGGAGFIGSHLANKLSANKKNKIYIIDLKNKIKKKNIIRKVNYITGDISKFSTFKKINKNIDIAYHLAAQTSNQIGEEKPKLNNNSNIKGTINFYNWAIKSKLKKCYFTSSMAVYGNNCKNRKENSKCYPKSNYGVSKLFGEKIITNLKKHKIDYTILRLFNVYGPGQDLENLKQGMISIYFSQALKYKSIKVAGSLNRTRDFIYIDDVIKAITTKTLPSNNIYNLGFGKEIKIYKAIKILSNQLKKKLSIYRIKKTPFDIYSSFANIDKIKMYGIRPKISLRQGIIKMINKTKKI